MKTDLSDEELKLIVEALEHYFAYTRAAQREDSRYQETGEQAEEEALGDANLVRPSPLCFMLPFVRLCLFQLLLSGLAKVNAVLWTLYGWMHSGNTLRA